MYSSETLRATQVSQLFIGLPTQTCRRCSFGLRLFTLWVCLRCFLWHFGLTVSGAVSLISQFALLLLQRPVQARDELEEASAEAFLFGFPLQRVERPLLLPRRGRRRSLHVAARAGAAAQLRFGCTEELAGRPETLLPLRLFVCVRGGEAAVHVAQARMVVVLGGRAEEAGAAAGAACAAQGSLSGGAGHAEAAVHAG